MSVKQKTKDALTQRKKFLLEGLVTTLRLPESPVLNSDESGDVIFKDSFFTKRPRMPSERLKSAGPGFDVRGATRLGGVSKRRQDC